MERAEFNENMFQAYIMNFYLNFVSVNNWNFYIPSNREEGGLGYDIKLSTPIPFFLQLKVPAFYKDRESSSDRIRNLSMRRRNLGYRDRNARGFFTIPWWNRGLNKNQHNLLFHLKEQFNNGGFVFYVAPIFYKYRTLKALIRESNFIYNSYRYTLNQIQRIINIYSENFLGNSFFIEFPFLRSSIYIEPHTQIEETDSEKHFYTYNIFKEVAFHSKKGKPVNSGIFFDYEILIQIRNKMREKESLTFERINNFIIKTLENRQPISSEIAKDIFYGFPSFLKFLQYNSNEKYKNVAQQLRKYREFLNKENFKEIEIETTLYSLIATYLSMKFNIQTFLIGR